MCKTIKLRAKFPALPLIVYRLLTDSKSHAEVTGSKASIGKEVGDPFDAFSGRISGVNVDLLPGKRIVQAWREKDFPSGIFSMVTITLLETKQGGTELTLTHRGVPKDLIPRTERLWRESYWERMKEVLAREEARKR